MDNSEILSYTPRELMRYMNEHHNYEITWPSNLTYEENHTFNLANCSDWILHDGRASIPLIQSIRLFNDFLDQVVSRPSFQFSVSQIKIEKIQIFEKGRHKSIQTRVTLKFNKDDQGQVYRSAKIRL